MAEPVIISYARGLLKEFPGVPEGTVDVIPVDLVVGAICAVAARGPANEDGAPDVTQVASGSANPLKYQRLVDLVQDWFTEHPLYDSDGQPISVPDWGFPGRGRVEGQLRAHGRPAHAGRPRRCSRPPAPGQAGRSGRPARGEARAGRAGPHLRQLYGAYTECEAIYGVDHLLALHESLAADDQRDVRHGPPGHRLGPLRPRDPPAVGGEARPGPHRRLEGRRASPRSTRLRRQVLSPSRQMAAFDLENTLIASNVVTSLRLAGHPPPRPRRPLRLVAQASRRGARPAQARPRRPQRLPPPLLPPLRGRPGRPAARATRPRCCPT